MRLRSISAVSALAITLLCASAAQAKTVTLGSSDNRTDVSLNLGDTLVVELSSGQVKGFSWVSHLPKASALTKIRTVFACSEAIRSKSLSITSGSHCVHI